MHQELQVCCHQVHEEPLWQLGPGEQLARDPGTAPPPAFPQRGHTVRSALVRTHFSAARNRFGIAAVHLLCTNASL